MQLCHEKTIQQSIKFNVKHWNAPDGCHQKLERIRQWRDRASTLLLEQPRYKCGDSRIVSTNKPPTAPTYPQHSLLRTLHHTLADLLHLIEEKTRGRHLARAMCWRSCLFVLLLAQVCIFRYFRLQIWVKATF